MSPSVNGYVDYGFTGYLLVSGDSFFELIPAAARISKRVS